MSLFCELTFSGHSGVMLATPHVYVALMGVTMRTLLVMIFIFGSSLPLLLLGVVLVVSTMSLFLQFRVCLIWWCGTLKRVVWYFEEGGVVL